MANGNKQILERLDVIKSELDYIKERIEDVILTEDDIKSIEEAEKEFKARKTISHEKLKKELGL